MADDPYKLMDAPSGDVAVPDDKRVEDIGNIGTLQIASGNDNDDEVPYVRAEDSDNNGNGARSVRVDTSHIMFAFCNSLISYASFYKQQQRSDVARAKFAKPYPTRPPRNRQIHGRSPR